MPGVRGEIRRLSVLAAPVVLTQLSTMLLGVVDALMVGRVGPEHSERRRSATCG